ncbi:MAG: hypothetical protein KDC53_13875 [Saprospiraceae bacterium]|nr:hypothetical protein [Saprospiraceae bacterium]
MSFKNYLLLFSVLAITHLKLGAENYITVATIGTKPPTMDPKMGLSRNGQ